MNQLQTAARYKWTDLTPDHPMSGIERRRIIGEHMMLSEVLLEKGCFVPSHVHDNEQIALVVRGRIQFGLGREGSPEHEEMVLGAGEILHLPPNVPHSAKALEETLVLDLFSPISEKTGIDLAGR